MSDLTHPTLPEGVTLRDWEERDFPAIQRLSDAEGWPTPSARPEAALAAWHHSWPALVVEHSGDIIGFLRALSDGSVTTFVAEIFIAPEWRGRGLGRALLEAAQRLAPGSRLEMLATPESRTYYEHIGFRPFFAFRRSWEELM